MTLARRAVKANKGRIYFNTESTAEYEESLRQAMRDKKKDPKDRDVVVLPFRDPFTISDKDHWELYEAALKDHARAYFEYNGPITVYPIEKATVDAQPGTILTVLWFRSFDGASIFYGFSRNLNHGDRARAVIKKGNAERSINNPSPGYSKGHLTACLATIANIKEGVSAPSELASVEDLLRSLIDRLT